MMSRRSAGAARAVCFTSWYGPRLRVRRGHEAVVAVSVASTSWTTTALQTGRTHRGVHVTSCTRDAHLRQPQPPHSSSTPATTAAATPSPEVFQCLSSGNEGGVPATPGHNKHRTSRLVLHTGYAKDSAASADSSPAPSFAVLDEEALNRIIQSALRAASYTTCAPSTTATEERISAAPFVSDATGSSKEPRVGCDVVVVETTVTCALHARLREVRAELDALLAVKNPIDRYIDHRYYPLLKYGMFALLLAQFVVYFDWIFFVFDWNLVEPTTYFLGYTAVFASIVYHYRNCGKDDFGWRNLFRFQSRQHAEKLYAKKGVDATRVAALQSQVAAIEAELRRYGQLRP